MLHSPRESGGPREILIAQRACVECISDTEECGGACICKGENSVGPLILSAASEAHSFVLRFLTLFFLPSSVRVAIERNGGSVASQGVCVEGAK